MTDLTSRPETIEERDPFDAWLRAELRAQAEPVMREPIPEAWTALLSAD